MSPTTMMKTSGRAIVLALGLPLAAACVPDYEPDSPEPTSPVVRDADGARLADSPLGCSLEARPSAIAQLVDGHGGVITNPHAIVEYAFDDGTRLHPASCLGPDCERWIAGYERSGQLTITAQACGGTGVTEVDVPLTTDGCHVETRYPRITLRDADCRLPLTAPTPGQSARASATLELTGGHA